LSDFGKISSLSKNTRYNNYIDLCAVWFCWNNTTFVQGKGVYLRDRPLCLTHNWHKMHICPTLKSFCTHWNACTVQGKRVWLKIDPCATYVCW